MKFEARNIKNEQPQSLTFKDILPGKDGRSPSAGLRRWQLPCYWRNKMFDLNEKAKITKGISLGSMNVRLADDSTYRKREFGIIWGLTHLGN